jgi:hypothetical protein
MDEAVVGRWAECLVAERLDPIRAAFKARGARGPKVVWEPTIDLLEARPLRVLQDYWSDLAAGRAMPLASEIDPLDMREALGHVALLDVIEDGRDFRYRVFGTAIAAVSEFDLTGRNVSESPASAYIVEFALAIYRAACARKAPVFTEHGPAGTHEVHAWQRLILPLADKRGQVTRLLSGNHPVLRRRRSSSARP